MQCRFAFQDILVFALIAENKHYGGKNNKNCICR